MEKLRSLYHFCFAALAALWYRFPSREIFVLGITGTKGKTTTLELINASLEAAGYRTAIASTLRFKLAEQSEPNKLKMTMPGRARLQKFLRAAVRAHCDYALIEMTSEGAKQSRQRFIELNTLIFTNLSPEHLESHGSWKKYLAAKLKIAKQLKRSKKPGKMIIANGDDKTSKYFLAINVSQRVAYHLKEVEPLTISETKCSFTFRGLEIKASLGGRFNLYNFLAAATFADRQGIPTTTIKRAFENFFGVRGRLERFEARDSNPIWPNFSVIVDYAHTPDSLKQLYEIFTNRKKICVLGATGGGRDKWKRPVMGQIAEQYCRKIFLTNEDPYDEKPEVIISEIATKIKRENYEIIMDRREAIRRAFSEARDGEIVILTGKGTDPYIMGPRGSKIPWDEASIVKEELANAGTA